MMTLIAGWCREPAVDLEAGAVAEADVEEHDVRSGRGHQAGDLVGRLGLAGDLDPGHLGDGDREAHAEHRVVVDDRHPQHGMGGAPDRRP
jgi:hypothetical protein